MPGQGGDTFADRFDAGAAWEVAVCTVLEYEHGWKVSRPDDYWAGPVRDVAPAGAAIRNMPDVMICRDGGWCSYVEIKSSGRHGGNVSIAVSCLTVLADIASTGFPVFIVCGNGKVLTVDQVQLHGRPGPQSGRGSGQPYLLVPADLGMSFGSVFAPGGLLMPGPIAESA